MIFYIYIEISQERLGHTNMISDQPKFV